MTYQQTLEWMYAQLPMYQRQGAAAYKPNLDRSLALDAHTEYPSRQIKAVHVAGTNGKGSTSHMLASILQVAGYNVGLYTSPHLLDFRERIRINGEMIAEDEVVAWIKNHQEFIVKHKLSFFEMTVGMAFSAFAKKSIAVDAECITGHSSARLPSVNEQVTGKPRTDVCIIETGLGGRLDSTNILEHPLVSVITNVALDHTNLLGDTIAAIASEKAGIMKSNVPVVLGAMHPDALEVILEKAADVGAPVSMARPRDGYATDLQGIYQVENVATAVSAIEQLREQGYHISDAHVKSGLLQVASTTGLRGRFERLGERPMVICDTGHNPAGLELVMQQLEAETYNRLHMVVGFVGDKDVEALISLMPKEAIYYAVQSSVPRSMSHKAVAGALEIQDRMPVMNGSVEEGVQHALRVAGEQDLIFIGGSTFVVADALKLF